ncbi:MAG: carbohydrate ABC transporter permease [Caldilineaceae bacterium]|nr:carbohydrate ABC transporter permease [Caldilineaceae bacterium]
MSAAKNRLHPLPALPAQPAPTVRAARRAGPVIGRLAVHLFLIVLSISCLLPLVWMISTSFKEQFQVFSYPPEWLPDPWTLKGYQRLFSMSPIGNWLFNSVLVAVTITACQLVFSSLAAYAFARVRFPGRDVIFMGYLATMMIPSQVTLIPGYILIKYLGWIDTYFALTVPFLFGSAFGTFLLRQFFQTIPTELEDAARIDGAGYFDIYWRIILPLAKPALATLGVFVFLHFWNDFLWPLIVINTNELRTLPVGLAVVSRSMFGTDWPALMGGAVISLVPILTIFFFAQRYFVQGITLTGLKG